MKWIEINAKNTLGNFTRGKEVLIMLKWGQPVVARLVGNKWFTGLVWHDVLNVTHYCIITPPQND